MFFSLNWIGVKIKLKIRLIIKGKRMISVIWPCHAIRNTIPKDKAINKYKNVQTGPKSLEGGAHEGLINFEYQL